MGYNLQQQPISVLLFFFSALFSPYKEQIRWLWNKIPLLWHKFFPIELLPNMIPTFFATEPYHFMSIKRMSMISSVCLGSGLGAGDNTFITCVCVSTLVTTMKPQTGLSTRLFREPSSPSSALLTLSTWYVRSLPGVTGTSFSCVSSWDIPSGKHESGMDGAPIL